MTFLLFCGEHDWTEGGAWDLEGAYASEAQARRAFDEAEDDYDWAHILLVDGLETKIVRQHNCLGWRDIQW